MRIVAGFTEFVRHPKSGEVRTHIPECGFDGSRSIVTRSALGVGVGEGQADVIAEDAGNMGRVGVVATVANWCTGKCCLSVAFGRRQTFIWSGNGLNDGTRSTYMAAFAGNAAGAPKCHGHCPDVTGITGSEGNFLRTVGMVGRVDGMTGFT